MQETLSPLAVVIWTAIAMVAFAANSVLCRMALGAGLMDAASFTSVRLLSGAITLMILLQLKTSRGKPSTSKGSWLSALMLFVYAAGFSFAYLSLDTGTGALILFGVVQITMILAALTSGDRLSLLEWAGVGTAFGGFVYLVLPGVSAPSPKGFALMSLAGIGWGIYSLKGRGSRNPLADTGYNFLRAVPLTLLLTLAMVTQMSYESKGLILAVISGALTSGVGYAVWYTALPGLSSVQAAVVQLSVPVIAALGGVLLVGEQVSLRLIIAGLLILGGIALVIKGRMAKADVRP